MVHGDCQAYSNQHAYGKNCDRVLVPSCLLSLRRSNSSVFQLSKHYSHQLVAEIGMSTYNVIRPGDAQQASPNFFVANGTNSTRDLGPKGNCIPIFIKFQQRLTTPPKLRRFPDRVTISTIKGPTELRNDGQTLLEFDKKWYVITFWPKVPRGVCHIGHK